MQLEDGPVTVMHWEHLTDAEKQRFVDRYNRGHERIDHLTVESVPQDAPDALFVRYESGDIWLLCNCLDPVQYKWLLASIPHFHF